MLAMRFCYVMTNERMSESHTGGFEAKDWPQAKAHATRIRNKAGHGWRVNLWEDRYPFESFSRGSMTGWTRCFGGE